MAALPLCASWFPHAAIAVASRSARPTSRVMPHARPLRRRGPSLAIQACTRDHHSGRDPEPESDDDESDVEASIEIPFPHPEDAEDEGVRNRYEGFRASMGLREAPDMFPIERDEISNYMIRIASSRANDQDVNNKVMALLVCAEAQNALDLASRIMVRPYEYDKLRRQYDEFSQDTINQMVRRYTPIFLNVAKDAYSKRIKIVTVLSFLGALRGLGAVCHILVQDTVGMLIDSPLKNSINSNTVALSNKFDKRLDCLKEELMLSAEATGIKHTLVMDMLFNGMKRARSYVVKLIQLRREALDHVFRAFNLKIEERRTLSIKDGCFQPEDSACMDAHNTST
ncbi:hypothetical protein C2845_PM07G20310 [Panicum miliaceum]|uniref:Uncharacterized protein n=1 Tax=Panicum miliaceum TaxID=4540 RepID=A0A3L6SUX0_PANMI|nr:hypothetical protein C2845_PM07G20310 [Panicum miliaceum]